jgi:hypothetical protein
LLKETEREKPESQAGSQKGSFHVLQPPLQPLLQPEFQWPLGRETMTTEERCHEETGRQSQRDQRHGSEPMLTERAKEGCE